MNENQPLRRAKRAGVGRCFAVFPVIWACALAAHGAPQEAADRSAAETDRCRSLAAQLESPGACSESGRSLAGLLRGYAGFGFSGAVLVADADAILLHEAYGLADSETGRANSVATRFPLLSVTKTLVATSLLRLTQEGKLDLDRPLSEYLGEFPEEKAAATPHHLLTHTAGLIQEGFSTRSPVLEEFVANVKSAPMENPPGAAYRYSNAGSSLAAALQQVVAGIPWDAYLSEAVFEVAGVESAAVLRGENPPDLASGHRGQGAERRVMNFSNAPPYVSELWWGAAGATGVIATAADVYRWLASLADGRLLTGLSRRRMLTAHVEDQGYGWHVDEVDGHRRYWKGGGAPMYEYQVAWYPDDGWIVVLAMNDHVGWRVPVWTAIERLLLGHEPHPLPETAGPAGALGEGVAGSYRTPSGDEVRLVFEAGHLTYEPGELAEESRLPRKSLLLWQTTDGDLAGLEVVAARPETPLTRLALREGRPVLTLADGSVIELTPLKGNER